MKSREDSSDAVKSLCSTFHLDESAAVAEWNLFFLFLEKRSLSESSMNDVLRSLIVDDLADAFPTLSKLAAILLACPLGTATVERSFSVMTRVCNKLRQRLPETI